MGHLGTTVISAQMLSNCLSLKREGIYTLPGKHDLSTTSAEETQTMWWPEPQSTGEQHGEHSCLQAEHPQASQRRRTFASRLKTWVKSRVSAWEVWTTGCSDAWSWHWGRAVTQAWARGTRKPKPHTDQDAGSRDDVLTGDWGRDWAERKDASLSGAGGIRRQGASTPHGLDPYFIPTRVSPLIPGGL